MYIHMSAIFALTTIKKNIIQIITSYKKISTIEIISVVLTDSNAMSNPSGTLGMDFIKAKL